MPSDPSILDHVTRPLAKLFLETGSTFSLVSLASALGVAVLIVGVTRLRRRGRVSLRLLLRALRPSPRAFGPSGKADLGWALVNTFSIGALIGWGLLSQVAISSWTAHALGAAFGAHAPWLRGWPAAAATTAAMFLAYDLGYWVDHWLSHRVPWLWQIHKVHHTAEALTPLTNFRVHPLESLKFYNIVALSSGAVDGALTYALGGGHGRLQLLGADAAWLAFSCTLLHLQHSHVWITLPGRWAKLLMSPAAHQIHHSVDPRHHGRNLGNALAVWDLLAGSLYVPRAAREPLRFGVDGEQAPHSITGGLITPVADAGRVLAADLKRLGRRIAPRSHADARGLPVDLDRPLA